MAAGYNLVAINSNLEVPRECPRRAPKHPLKTPRSIFGYLSLCRLGIAGYRHPRYSLWSRTADECTDGTRTIYYNSPSLYQEFKVKIKDSKIVGAEPGAFLTIGATLDAEQVEYTDSRATYRVDLSTLGRPSRICLLECDIRGTTLHMSEIQMRPDKRK